MSGIFTNAGVASTAALNTVDVETTCPDTELFYATSGVCNSRFDPEAMNALISEILNVISLAGNTYNCANLTNLHSAIKLMSTVQVATVGTVVCDGQMIRSDTGELFINLTGADITLTGTDSATITTDGLTVVGADTDVENVAITVTGGVITVTLTENGNDVSGTLNLADLISGAAGNALVIDASDDLLSVAAGGVTPATDGALGGVELGTQGEIEAGTAAGSVGPLVITPDHIVALTQMANTIDTANDFLIMVDVSTGQIKHVKFDDLPASGGAAPLPTAANAASWTWNASIPQAGTVVAPAGPTTDGYWEGTVFTDTGDFVGAAASNTGFVSETNPGTSAAGAGDGEAIICSAGAALTKNNLFGGAAGPARVAMHWSARA